MSDLPLINALGCAVKIDDANLAVDRRSEIGRVWADAASVFGDPLPVAHLTVVPSRGPLAECLSSLSQAVTLAAIEARRGQLWMLHAAGIADEEGRVIALIGPSGQGKTTAARTLAAAYGYVSDETVGIEADGTVVPYRKPLSVIVDSKWVKEQRPPGELGLRPLPQAHLRLAAVVLLDRRPDGPDAAVVEDCDLGETLPELVAQTSYLGDMTAPLRTIAAHAEAVGGVRRVVYREASTLAAALEPLFRDPQPVRIGEPTTSARPAADAPGTYRAAFLDAISLHDPDRVALLQPELDGGSTFRLISGIGPALWRTAVGGSLDGLAAAAEEAYGSPEGLDIRAAVDSAVDVLAEQGVLAGEPTWRIRDDVAVTGEEGRFVALSLADLQHPSPFAMEGSAAIIWDVLSASRGAATTRLVEAVAQRAGVSADVVDADVRAFLDELEVRAFAERIAP
jgi:energy-coupling factor transporter ATP-binding protein EcfA2